MDRGCARRLRRPLIWLGFYLLSSNQHLRTWGGIRALVLFWGLIVLALNLAVAAANLDAVGAVASLFILLFLVPFGWDTWRRISWTQRTVRRGYEQAQEIEQWLDDQQKLRRGQNDRPLSREQLQNAREDLRRIRIVQAAVTGARTSTRSSRQKHLPGAKTTCRPFHTCETHAVWTLVSSSLAWSATNASAAGEICACHAEAGVRSKNFSSNANPSRVTPALLATSAQSTSSSLQTPRAPRAPIPAAPRHPSKRPAPTATPRSHRATILRPLLERVDREEIRVS